jgi:hypothetical protein
VANCLVLTKVDADPPSPRSSQRPRGRVVLPIFIRQGWPQAMSHLSEMDGRALCYRASSQVVSIRERHKDGVNGRAFYFTANRPEARPELAGEGVPMFSA